MKNLSRSLPFCLLPSVTHFQRWLMFSFSNELIENTVGWIINLITMETSDNLTLAPLLICFVPTSSSCYAVQQQDKLVTKSLTVSHHNIEKKCQINPDLSSIWTAVAPVCLSNVTCIVSLSMLWHCTKMWADIFWSRERGPIFAAFIIFYYYLYLHYIIICLIFVFIFYF